MTRQFCLIASLVASTVLASCAYPYPYPATYPTTTTVPADFDRSWNAALGAAADAGVQVTSADQASGRITGSKAGAQVVIALLRQANGSVQVSFNGSDSSLTDRLAASYERRMGR